MLLELFWVFFKIGLVSFGGGYAMIPVIQHEIAARQWMTDAQFAEAVSLAGMAPGPIATNCAIYIGFHTAGIAGSVAAALGIILPSVFIIILIISIFYKLYRHKQVKAAFYGLRPVVVGLIFFAAIKLILANPAFHSVSRDAWMTGLLAAAAFVAILKYKMHPLSVILLSGLVGIAVYT